MKTKITKDVAFRIWFYFRQGWSVYFAFMFAAVNTLVVTYYLAIQKAPFLQQVFPSFIYYVLAAVGLGIPILVTVGYVHMKRSAVFKTEADISIEANPHMRRLLLNTEEILQHQLFLTEILIKTSTNEKLDEKDLNSIKNIKSELEKYLDKKTIE